MDPPDTPPPPPPPAAASKESPVFDFIKTLSPIATSKCLDAAQNAQLFKSSDLAHISSIFTSPQVNSQKGSNISIGNTSAQPSQEGLSPYCHMTPMGTSSSVKQSGPMTIASKNCSIDRSLSQGYHGSPENASILPNSLPQHIPLIRENLVSDKRQDTTGKTDHAAAQKHAKVSCFDRIGLENMVQLTSGMNVQKRDLAKKCIDELIACNRNYLSTQCGSSVVPTSDLTFETAAQLAETPKIDNGMPSISLLPISEANLENSQRKLFHVSADCYVKSAVDNVHDYCTSRGKGVAKNYVSRIPSYPRQSQMVPDHQFCDTLEVPSDYMAMNHNAVSRHLRGLHRRSLFNEKVRDPTTGVYSVSNLRSSTCTTSHRSIRDDNYLKSVGSPVFALPGDLHLDALAPMPEFMVPYNMTCTVNPTLLISEHNTEMNSVIPGKQLASNTSKMNTHPQNDCSSQATMPTNAGNSGQENPKRKRQKCQNGDVDSCKRCSCKKSKCLKLYCACFAAKVYCSESCSCRGCFNNHSHEETVLSTRIRIESRNPLAFAPKVIRACGPGLEFGEDSNATPASSRHKRGCNCKKSYCLKKYCECFQSGVGCSMSCRCECCKNEFGIRKVFQLLDTEEIERVDPKKKAHPKEEQSDMGKHHAFAETCGVSSTMNLFMTPSIESIRPLALPASECSNPLPSSPRTSQLYSRTDPDGWCPFRSYTEMILRNDPSDMQQGDSSCTASFKFVSPNNELSPTCRSDRLLKSMPFRSLTSDFNNELQ